jgi:hypothetical protein
VLVARDGAVHAPASGAARDPPRAVSRGIPWLAIAHALRDGAAASTSWWPAWSSCRCCRRCSSRRAGWIERRAVQRLAVGALAGALLAPARDLLAVDGYFFGEFGERLNHKVCHLRVGRGQRVRLGR